MALCHLGRVDTKIYESENLFAINLTILYSVKLLGMKYPKYRLVSTNKKSIFFHLNRKQTKNIKIDFISPIIRDLSNVNLSCNSAKVVHKF